MSRRITAFLSFLSIALGCALLPALAQTSTKSSGSPSASSGTGSASEKGGQNSAGQGAAGQASGGSVLLKRAKSAYQSGQFKEAEDRLNRLVKAQGKSTGAEEALVMLADIHLRLNRPDLAQAAVMRFRRYFGSSAHLPRMTYYQGQAALRQGRNGDAAKAFATAAASAANTSIYGQATKGLWHLVESGILTAEELEAAAEALDRDPALRAGLMERIGDQYLREGRYQAARNTFEEWLERFRGTDGAGRVRAKLKQAADAPQQNRTVLIMAPMTGEFSEIGKSVKEGSLLAIDENNARGAGRVETRYLDDQGSLIVGIHRLRKTMREEKIDAILGPAMSDVSAAAAVDLSARRSKIPMVTPTATTHGIAALGEGIFQLNVTTGTLGQRVATYAVGCLKLKDFAIVAPNSEYGYQLAEAFQRAVERKGGNILTTQYYDPDANDLSPQMGEIRKLAAKIRFEKLKMEGGAPDPDPKTYAKTLSDSVIDLDGIFMPATNGEEAYKVASQAAFNKLRAQFLGSSGWNDKTMLHRSSSTSIQGAIFSVDFPENPRTEAWMNFNRAFSARWKHPPDKVAALAYDAATFLLQGMAPPGTDDNLIPNLKAIRSFNGVLGRIVFDEKYGANSNAAIYRVEKKGFREVESCSEAD